MIAVSLNPSLPCSHARNPQRCSAAVVVTDRDEYLSRLADRLVSARESAGFKTRAGAADAAGVSVNTMKEWELGRSDPSSRHLAVLAELYGVTADYLVGGADDPKGVPPGCFIIDMAALSVLEKARSFEDVRHLLPDPASPVIILQMPSLARVVDEERCKEIEATVNRHIRRLNGQPEGGSD